MLSKVCENELYLTCNIFLNYMNTKFAKEIKKYVKFGAKKNLKLLCKVWMINFDGYVSENRTEHNKNWPHTPDKPYRILIIRDWGSGRKKFIIEFYR